MFKLTKNTFIGAALVAMALVVAGCHDDDDIAQANLRVLHGVFDAPRVNVYLNDDLVLENVDFREGSGYLPVNAGQYDIRVEALIPGGNLDVIDVEDFPLDPNTWSTVVAVGTTSPLAISPLPIAEPTEDIGAGNIRLRVTHASPDVGPVYLAVTTPGAPIDQAELLGPLSYQQSSDPLVVPAGDYQVRVTVQPQPVTDADVVFDSGPLPTLAEGTDLHAFAVPSTVPSTGATGSPVVGRRPRWRRLIRRV